MGALRFRLENRSGYDTSDLKRFFAKGLRATRAGGGKRTLQIVVVSAPARSRGCAEVGGWRMTIAIASPSNFSLRRLARLFMHEAAHLDGLDHEDMPRSLLYSLGPIPPWAHGFRIRYRGRAPDQLRMLRI